MRSILEESRLKQCLYIVTIVIQLRWCVSICGLCAISEISFRLSSIYTLFLPVSLAIRCRWCCGLFHETIMSPNSRHGMAGWAVPSFPLSFFFFFAHNICPLSVYEHEKWIKPRAWDSFDWSRRVIIVFARAEKPRMEWDVSREPQCG